MRWLPSEDSDLFLPQNVSSKHFKWAIKHDKEFYVKKKINNGVIWCVMFPLWSMFYSFFEGIKVFEKNDQKTHNLVGFIDS